MHVNKIDIKNQVFKCYLNNWFEAKKLKARSILIDEKIHKNLMIYFTRYVNSELIKILGLHYGESIEKIEKQDGEKYVMVEDDVLDIVLARIKRIIGIKNLIILRF